MPPLILASLPSAERFSLNMCTHNDSDALCEACLIEQRRLSVQRYNELQAQIAHSEARAALLEQQLAQARALQRIYDSILFDTIEVTVTFEED